MSKIYDNIKLLVITFDALCVVHVIIHCASVSNTVCQSLLSRIEEFWSAYGVLETWVTEREASLTDCGPIGANLPRLSEQMEILKV